MVFIASAAGILCLATAAAFFGQVWWVLDAVASFRPQLAAGLVVTALVLMMGKWRRLSLLALTGAAVNIALIAPLYVGPARPSAGDLRVLSFNLLSSNRHYEDVISYILNTDADLVVLHEGTRQWERVLTRAGLPYQITATRATEDLFGTIVLAPQGSVVQSFGFGVSDPRAVEVHLPDGVSALAIHPLSPYDASRAALNQEQLGFAAEWAGANEGPTVVVGDFNASPWSYGFRRLVTESGLLDSQRGFGLELSYPATTIPLFQVSIDHLLHSDDLAVVDRRLGPRLGSDHFPLIVDLALLTAG